MSKKKMLPCTCKHLGNCPFNHTHFLAKTYVGGGKVFRGLTALEQRQARIAVNGQTLRETPLGAFVGSDKQGDATLVAMPIEAEKTVEWAKAQVGRRCKGDKLLWRMRNKVPKDDTVVTAEQVPPEQP